MSLTHDEEAAYRAAWAVLSAIDMLYEKIDTYMRATRDAQIFNDSTPLLELLRELMRRRIQDFEKRDELTRVRRELAQAQQRIAELEQRSGGDGE